MVEKNRDRITSRDLELLLYIVYRRNTQFSQRKGVNTIMDNQLLNILIKEIPIKEPGQDSLIESEKNLGMKSVLSMVNRKQNSERPTMSITCDLMAHR